MQATCLRGERDSCHPKGDGAPHRSQPKHDRSVAEARSKRHRAKRDRSVAETRSKWNRSAI
eukprot:5279155-Pleurochrysis_carterae.AAC.1